MGRSGSLGEAPGVVVEEDAAAYDAFGGPGADAEGVCLGSAVSAVDLVEGGIVVEEGFLLVADWRRGWVLALVIRCCCWGWGWGRRTVAEAIPLGAALRVEGPDVVVDDTGRLLVDFLVEGLPAEEGDVFLGVQGPVESDTDAGLDLAGGGFDDVVGEAVEGAE